MSFVIGNACPRHDPQEWLMRSIPRDTADSEGESAVKTVAQAADVQCAEEAVIQKLRG